MEGNTFKILLDGVEKEATMLTVLEMDGKEYAVYTVPADGEDVDILYSEVVKDASGNDTLVDVEDLSIKEKIKNEINELLA